MLSVYVPGSFKNNREELLIGLMTARTISWLPLYLPYLNLLKENLNLTKITFIIVILLDKILKI